MIAVDTSALMAIILDETEAEACIVTIESAERLMLSAATAAEARIVAARRGVGDKMARLIDDLGVEICAVTAATVERVAHTYDRWGKGVHPAALNFCDCFAYALAEEHGCPLLYIGQDFAKTDIAPAIVAKV